VSTAAKEPTHDEKSRAALQEDIGIVDASLQFINELLRNMLDMHRASDRQLIVRLYCIATSYVANHSLDGSRLTFVIKSVLWIGFHGSRYNIT
jgi:hypothetical protein